MSNTLEIYKDSFNTLFANTLIQSTPNSSATAYNLSGLTVLFEMSDTLTNAAVICKSSTDPTEILITSATAGEMEIYILHTDTTNLVAGRYYYTIYVLDLTGKRHHVKTDKIKLLDTVQAC